jgi:hypothetical protein
VLLKSTPLKDRTLRVDKGPMFLRKLAGILEEPSRNTSSRLDELHNPVEQIR